MPDRIGPDRLQVDGYIRISRVAKREGEHFISPIVQREDLERWARRQGADLLIVHEELDESGRRADRPLLELAVRRIERGLSQGLVVPTVDRFGRSQLDGLLMIRRVQQAGGHFFSAAENFDLGDAAGRYLLRELLSVAEFQSDRLGIGWQQAKRQMIARGAYPASRIPFGYRRARSGRLTPDPRTAPYVTELFRRRAAGAPLYELSRFMETAGIKTANGNTGWSGHSINGICHNRAYLGELHWGAIVRLDIHPPLTDGATWQRAQRPPLPPRHRAQDTPPAALLTGMLRCAACSMSMVYRLVRKPHRSYPTYCCGGRSAAGPCPARAYIQVPLIEAYIVGEAFRLLRERRTRRPAATTGAQARLARAEQGLRHYRDSEKHLSSLDAAVFAEGLSARNQLVAAARLDLALAREADDLDGLPTADDLQRQWPAMTVEARRAVLARLIDCAFVGRGHLPIADRVTICPTGTAPRDLPRVGDRVNQARPFRPRERHIGGRRVGTRPAGRWSNARLERELRAFLRDQPHWPVADAFIRAGRGELLQQARLRASDQWWAFHFKLPMQHPPRGAVHWTEADIRAELTTYLADKPTWPTSRQFTAAGYGPLHLAMQRTGGLARWASEFPSIACPQAFRWTDQAIRDALKPLCANRTRFPTYQQCGHRLNHAIDRRGRAWWAAQFNLPLNT